MPTVHSIASARIQARTASRAFSAAPFSLLVTPHDNVPLIAIVRFHSHLMLIVVQMAWSERDGGRGRVDCIHRNAEIRDANATNKEGDTKML